MESGYGVCRTMLIPDGVTMNGYIQYTLHAYAICRCLLWTRCLIYIYYIQLEGNRIR